MTIATVSKAAASSAIAIGAPTSCYFIYDHIKNAHLSSLDKEILKNIKEKTFQVGDFSDDAGSEANKSISSEVKTSITVGETDTEWKCFVKAVAVESGESSIDLSSSKGDLKTELSNILGSSAEENKAKKEYFVWNCALNRGEDKVAEGKESTLIIELQKKSGNDNKWEFKDLDRVFTGTFKNFVIDSAVSQK